MTGPRRREGAADAYRELSQDLLRHLCAARAALHGIAHRLSPEPGIDFTGGAAITAVYETNASSSRVSDALTAAGQPDAIVQEAGGNTFFIRLGILELDERDAAGNVIRRGDESRVRDTLAGVGPVEISSFDSVSGIIGAENVRNATIAVIVPRSSSCST